MPLFAVYRKTKRAKNLTLVAWPVLAENKADAVRVVLDDRKNDGEPVKRLRAMGPYSSADVEPLTEISHHDQFGRRPL